MIEFAMLVRHKNATNHQSVEGSKKGKKGKKGKKKFLPFFALLALFASTVYLIRIVTRLACKPFTLTRTSTLRSPPPARLAGNSTFIWSRAVKKP